MKGCLISEWKGVWNHLNFPPMENTENMVFSTDTMFSNHILSTLSAHLFKNSFPQLLKTVDNLKKSLFYWHFYLLINVCFNFTFRSFQHFSELFTMWTNYPLIIHFLKIVENCGKLFYTQYIKVFYIFFWLWINFLSTIFMWILHIRGSKIDDAP